MGSEPEEDALKMDPALLADAETMESADVGRVNGKGLMRPLIGLRLEPADADAWWPYAALALK